MDWIKVNDEEYANIFGMTGTVNDVWVLEFEENDITTKARYDDGNKGYEVEVPTSSSLWDLVEEGKEA